MMTGAFCRAFLPLSLTITIVMVASLASAQSEEDRSAARALATQGISAFNEGRHADALDLFSRAESLIHAPPHVLYMARSAAEVGQLVRARELYLKLGREELGATAPQAFRDAQRDAREEVKTIEPRLANIVIKVNAPTGVAYKVEMDKRPVSAAVIGVPFPADPGKHQLVATASGYQSNVVEVTLAEGGRGTAELVLEATGAGPLGLAPGATPPPGGSGQPGSTTATTGFSERAAASRPPAWMRPASFVALGVGVVGLGVGTYFGLNSRSLHQDADKLAEQCGSPCLKKNPLASRIESKDDSARTNMTLSIVSFVVGGVGVATGATLFVLSSRKPGASAVTVTPFVGWGSAGLSGIW